MGGWVAVVVMFNALSGAQAQAVRDAVYSSENDCKAAVARNVPAKLDDKGKMQVAEGTRRYVCVRMSGTAPAPKAK